MCRTSLLINNMFSISDETLSFAKRAEDELTKVFEEIDEISHINFSKVLYAMQKNRLSEAHFAGTTGYGYNDIGRDTLEKIYADIFHTEAALVRPHIISGTHALTLALFGNLKYGDEMISCVGAPYDTLLGVIGVKKTKGSLIDNGITYKQVELDEAGGFNFTGIKSAMTNKTKLVLIQKSKGYSFRRSLSVPEIGELIAFIKGINPSVICMVDNCYGEFCELSEPSEVGADLTVGSLIKNMGGGLAPCGGYICGKAEYVENAAIRLSSPGLGSEVGPGLSVTSKLIQGLFLAPSVVAGALKGAAFASKLYENLGFLVSPKPFDKRTDIVQAIQFNDPKKVLAFCEGIQKAAPVDSFVRPEPWDMPGYDNRVVMAAGAFVQGASIELSADAPMREPYNVYFQGGLSWQHARLGNIIALEELYKDNLIQYK